MDKRSDKKWFGHCVFCGKFEVKLVKGKSLNDECHYYCLSCAGKRVRPYTALKQYETHDLFKGLGIACPECGWQPSIDFPDDRYIVVHGMKKGVKIIKNYWKPCKDGSAYEENHDVTKKIKKRIYPIFSNGTRNVQGGQDWHELHCCPVHGEFGFDNGYP